MARVRCFDVWTFLYRLPDRTQGRQCVSTLRCCCSLACFIAIIKSLCANDINAWIRIIGLCERDWHAMIGSDCAQQILLHPVLPMCPDWTACFGGNICSATWRWQQFDVFHWGSRCNVHLQRLCSCFPAKLATMTPLQELLYLLFSTIDVVGMFYSLRYLKRSNTAKHLKILTAAIGVSLQECSHFPK